MPPPLFYVKIIILAEWEILKVSNRERMPFIGFVDMYRNFGFSIYAEAMDKYLMIKQFKRSAL